VITPCWVCGHHRLRLTETSLRLANGELACSWCLSDRPPLNVNVARRRIPLEETSKYRPWTRKSMRLARREMAP